MPNINWKELLDLKKNDVDFSMDFFLHVFIEKCLLYMISPGYLGLLKSLSKLETRYINNIVRKSTKQKKNFYTKKNF